MLKDHYPFYLANKPDYRNTDLEVTDKYTGKVVCHVAMANREVIDQAIAAAVKAETAMRRLRPYERKAVLQHCVKRFRERQDELAEALCIEAGKPIAASQGAALDRHV